MDKPNDKPQITISVGGDNSGNILVDNDIVISRLEQAGLRAVDDPALNARKLALFRALADGFNREELATLAFELAIDLDDIGGQSKQAQARELVEYMARRDRLPDLERAVRQARPSLLPLD